MNVPNRYVKCPVGPAGPCKHCGAPAVRIPGLTPMFRSEKQGGPAGFTLCRSCDVLALPVVPT